MSRIVVIGATGHVGTYLVPRLVRGGHEVVALSRGEREPYRPAPEWRTVRRVTADRAAEDAAGVFGERIAALAADAVVDMLCFTPESAQQLVDALRPARPLLVHCGSIWVHGPAARVPVTEDEPRTAFGAYGVGKMAIEALLHRETVSGGVASVVLHPGYITGVVVDHAAAGVAAWFGREPVVERVDWEQFERRVGAEHAGATREHVARSIAASIDRARDVLGNRPRYSALEALRESLGWLAANGRVELSSQNF